MKRSLLALASLALLVPAGRANAQPQAGAPSQQSTGGYGPSSSPPAAPLYEEIEILRRLLDRGIEKSYGSDRSFTFTHPGTFDASTVTQYMQWLGDKKHPFASLTEGVYLKGYGIVYSASLPLPPGDLLARSQAAGPPPLSDWERARRELLGQKEKPVPPQPQPQPVPLAEALLRVLAENGPHLSHLADNEQVTVAVTFRSESCLVCHMTQAGYGAANQNFWFGGLQPTPHLNPFGSPQPPQPYPPQGNPGGKPGEDPSAPKTTPPSSGPATAEGSSNTRREAALALQLWTNPQQPGSEAQQRLNLGDLHLKQGRFQEAKDTYQKAWMQYTQALRERLEKNRALNVTDVALYMGAAEACGKLAQAQLRLGDADGARKSLEHAEKFAKGARELATTGEVPPTASSVRLPGKLLISVRKEWLLQAGQGNKSYEELRKHASVELITFPEEKK